MWKHDPDFKKKEFGSTLNCHYLQFSRTTKFYNKHKHVHIYNVNWLGPHKPHQQGWRFKEQKGAHLYVCVSLSEVTISNSLCY